MTNEAAGVAARASAARRADLRAQVPARRVRPPGAAAGRPARGSHGAIARARSSASTRIASASSARRPAATSRPRPRRCSTRPKVRPARHSTPSARGRTSSRCSIPSSRCAIRLRTPTRAATCSARRRPRPRVERLSIETQVRRDMPPAFIVHTAEDKSVPLENSVAFSEALRRARRAGGAASLRARRARLRHAPDLGTTSGWTARWMEWMRAHRMACPCGRCSASDVRRTRALASRRQAAGRLGARHRGAAQGRPRQRHLPQSDSCRRSSRPVDPARTATTTT